MKLNLGSGKNYLEGFINIDNSSNTIKKDMDIDLNKYPYPFEESSIDYIYAFGIIEHLNSLKLFLEEVYRILKSKGKIRFRVPMAFTYADASDPTHHQHIIPNTFNKFNKYYFNRYEITNAKFKCKLWITIPFFHKIKFPTWMYHINSIITIFTGIEGVLEPIK